MFSSTTKEAAAFTKDSAANDLSNAVRSGKREAYNTADQFTGAANQAGRKVRHFFDDASHQLSDATDKVTVQIRNKPIQASLIALAAGFALGALLRR